MENEGRSHDIATRNEPVRRPYFGRRLRELRETYPERISRAESALPVLRATPSASAVIECMRQEAGYVISNAAYSEVENGLNVPRDPPRFVDAVALCLRLTGDEKTDLERRLAFDIVYGKLRERTRDVCPPDPSWSD